MLLLGVFFFSHRIEEIKITSSSSFFFYFKINLFLRAKLEMTDFVLNCHIDFVSILHKEIFSQCTDSASTCDMFTDHLRRNDQNEGGIQRQTSCNI